MIQAIRVAMAAAVAAGMAGCTTTDPSAVYFKGAGGDSNVFVAPGHAEVRKVAVMPFKAPTELIGVSVSDQVLTELLRTGCYELVERGQMAKVLSESELALAGLSAAKAAEVGKMLGADGVVIGTVDEYSMVAHRGGTYPAVGISARLIDCASGKVMWSVDLARRAEKDSTTLAEHGRQVIHEMVSALYRNWGVQRPAGTGTRGVRAGATPPAGSGIAARTPSGEGSSAPVRPVSAPPTAAPTMRLGDMGLRETKISWEPVGPEVRKIRIERGETAAGPFVEIATVSASARACTDKGTGSKPLRDGTAYYYRMVPLGAGGMPGAPGSVKESMTAPPPDPPPLVQGRGHRAAHRRPDVVALAGGGRDEVRRRTRPGGPAGPVRGPGRTGGCGLRRRTGCGTGGWGDLSLPRCCGEPRRRARRALGPGARHDAAAPAAGGRAHGPQRRVPSRLAAMDAQPGPVCRPLRRVPV